MPEPQFIKTIKKLIHLPKKLTGYPKSAHQFNFYPIVKILHTLLLEERKSC